MLKENYFKIIDTKEKAYWLGFIYADGYIETRNNIPYRLGIEINNEEEILIDRFIEAVGISPKYKKFRVDHNSVIIRFVNKHIIRDLGELGVIPRKSNIIELPEFYSRELYLAFLLGFFDGDGKTNTTRIVSGSKRFLEQIKKKFKLNFRIYKKNSPGYLKSRLIAGKGYSMSLGAELFNEMMDNYEKSLPKKRRRFQIREEKVENFYKR